MATEIKTSITINATPEQIWSVLTTFENYPTWNPFITSIAGELKEGARLKAQIDKMKFKPKLLVIDNNKELEWIGHLFVPGIFDGKHKFQIIDNGNGTCTFIQSEKFKGVLAFIFKKKLKTDVFENFNSMNHNLKKEVEGS